MSLDDAATFAAALVDVTAAAGSVEQSELIPEVPAEGEDGHKFRESGFQNQLWDDAYAKSQDRDPKLVAEYERILVKECLKISHDTPNCTSRDSQTFPFTFAPTC